MPKYFDGGLSQGFVSLLTGKTIIMIGYAMLGLFMPIFLYELFGYSAQLTLLYFGVSSLIYLLDLPFGGAILQEIGFRFSIGIGVGFGALFFAAFYFIDPGNLWYLIPFSLIALSFYRLFYWTPYHVSFAKISDGNNRTRQVALISAVRNVIGIFIPIMSGFIITQFDFDVLFLMSIVLYMVSGIPFMLMPKVKEKYKWSYAKTWKHFFSKRRRGKLLAFTAFGAQETIGTIVWPIFIFMLLDGSYLKVGAISTFIIAVTVITELLFGKLIDRKKQKKQFLRFGSILFSLGYIFKIFVTSAYQIFLVGIYHNLSQVFMQSSFDSLTYDYAADEGHFVDEFTVLHEMAVHIGKVLAVGLTLFMLLFLELQWAFTIAAAAVLLLNRIYRKESVQRKR